MNPVLWGEEVRRTFSGAYRHTIHLVMFPRKTEAAQHVVALVLYGDKLVFTRHKERGLEWPGGKVEKGESPLEAVIREIKEETGGIVRSAWLVGQYKVVPHLDEPFFKNIYVAEVAYLIDGGHSGEDTWGPVLLEPSINPDPRQGFSPLVCDGVFQFVLGQVLKNEGRKGYSGKGGHNV